MKDAVGIYIHIPFCIRKCQYCDFLSFAADEMLQNRYVDCLIREIQGSALSGQISGEKPLADTVFFGGGTPSILPASAIGRVLDEIRSGYDLADGAEITIECNPGTADQEKFQEYRQIGVNRISFGMQSAVDEELKLLGRIHTFADAVQSFEMARDAGFSNINLDLMSAIPGQTIQSFRYTLERACALKPEHISAYSLIVEEGTPFYERYGEVPPIEEETDREMYAMTKAILGENGYRRYEISNYAQDGYACRHNLKYWSGGEYIGFGLGASSKIKHIRYKNEAEFSTYIERTCQGQPVCKVEEVLTPEDERAEYMILGLRRMNGISRKEFAEIFAEDVMEVYGAQIRQSAEERLLRVTPERICLTDRGVDVSNYVLCRFL